MACVEKFDEKNEAYEQKVLPNAVAKGVVVEGWILRLAAIHRPGLEQDVHEPIWHFYSGGKYLRSSAMKSHIIWK